MQGFQLLVVGDRKTNAQWHQEGAIFLSVTEQKSLGFGLVTHTPLDSYTRKNLGYLYAIRNGARFIYDTDDDTAPIHSLEQHFVFGSVDIY